MAEKEEGDKFVSKEEAKHNALVKAVKETKELDRLAAENEKMVRHAMFSSFISKLHMERREAETEAACTYAKESQGWRLKEIDQEEKLAYILSKENIEKLKQDKIRQQLHECEELRELKKKLGLAYIQKSHVMQRAEKEVVKLREQYFSDLEKVQAEENVKIVKVFEQEQQQQMLDAKQQYRKSLQDQIIDRQKEREWAYRKSLEEKMFVDETLRTIKEEDMREQEFKRLKTKKAKEDLDSFKNARLLWLKREKELEEEEDRKINKYRLEKEKREQLLQEENRRKNDERNLLTLSCYNEMKKSENIRAERERIAEVLLDEDSRIKTEQKHKEEEEKTRRTLRELKEVSMGQLEQRLRDLEEQKKRENEYRKFLTLEYERGLQKEKEEEFKRRQDRLNYGRCLEEILADQHLERVKESVRMIADEKIITERKIETRRMIEEERIKILKTHSAGLLGFIPKGVLKEEDLQHMEPSVQDFYKLKNNE